MTILLASDLDRTLIYSEAAMALTADERPTLMAVEMYKGRQSAFMTSRAAELLETLPKSRVLVPVTTRIRTQLARVTLPGRAPRFAVAANGGCLLVDGEADTAWAANVIRQLAEVAPLHEVWDHISKECRPEWTLKLRNAEDLFCYAVLDRAAVPAGFLTQMAEWAARRGWSTSLQGRKLYWMPRTLTKSAAVAEIARRLEASCVLAAGDSLLDIDLLEYADAGLHPAHGEIADSGWGAPHVRRTEAAGVLAGEEICRWFHTADPGARR